MIPNRCINSCSYIKDLSTSAHIHHDYSDLFNPLKRSRHCNSVNGASSSSSSCCSELFSNKPFSCSVAKSQCQAACPFLSCLFVWKSQMSHTELSFQATSHVFAAHIYSTLLFHKLGSLLFSFCLSVDLKWTNYFLQTLTHECISSLFAKTVKF